ncbi:hypothetical protein MMC17_009615 [Xylographa soralifera]|nr:hypothetical protein [Xylographa soralifera]
MASEPISHLPSSPHAVHHFRSLPADLHFNSCPDAPSSEVQPATSPSYSHITPAQPALLLDQVSPAINSHTRSPSIRSTSRRRASRHHKLLFYPLLTTLELLLLALPITIVFLVQASVANGPFVPPLAAFFVLAFCACLAAAGVAVLFIRRRRSQLMRKRKLDREAQRWRTLARERGREVEVLRAVSERLRSSSRGRRQRDESMSRARSGSAGTGLGRDEEEGRSVSRGRTGRGVAMRDLDVEDGIAELEGLEIRMVRAGPVTDTTKGNVGRAKQAAFARMRGEAAEKPLPRIPRYSPPHPPPPPPHSPGHPPRQASLGWLTRWNAVKESQRRNAQPPISSPPQTQPGRLQKTVLLAPLEPVLDKMDSPGVQTTVLDRYTVSEQYRQALERQQEQEEQLEQSRRDDRERKTRQRQEFVPKVARHDVPGIRENNPVVGRVKDQHKPERRSNSALETAFDAESSDTGDEEDGYVEIGVAKIVRGGNGGRGDAQSDKNFEESHALKEDAVSLTESLRQKKKAESLRKVASWEDGTRVAAAEAEEEAVRVDPDVEASGRPAGPQEGEPVWREGLAIGRPSNSTKDENWEIHQRRRNFALFLETKIQQSKMAGPGKKSTV